jgi:hypothetical protein
VLKIPLGAHTSGTSLMELESGEKSPNWINVLHFKFFNQMKTTTWPQRGACSIEL